MLDSLPARPYLVRVPNRPITSPIARPGRRYVTGIVWLATVIVLALALVLARFLAG